MAGLLASEPWRAAPPPARGSGRFVVIAFAAVVACFLASTAYTLYRAEAIDAAALSIAEDAAPGIQFLATARAELRHLEVLLGEYVAAVARGEPGDPKPARASRAIVQKDLEAYLELPILEDEQTLWEHVKAELAELDRVTDRLFATSSPDGVTALLPALHEATDRVADAMLASLEFNAGQARDYAVKIERIRRTSGWLAIALDAVSVGLAALAAVLAARAVRRYTDLLERHGRFVREHASELEQFASRVAHDILSPLSSVELALGLIARETGPGAADRAELILRARRAVKRTRTIVDGLYEFARAGARPAPDARAEVAEILADAVAEAREAAAEAGTEVSLEPVAPATVACSPGVLTSLVANLLRNAVNHMGERPIRRVTVRARPAAERVRVEVEDTGPGIAPGTEDAIFEPYVRAPTAGGRPGLGLGLATVKRLVLAHGGAVGVRPAAGGGSLFWFELPRAAPPATAAGAPGAARTPQPS